jgi:hypothetical protein
MDGSERLIAVAALAPPDEAVKAWAEWRATYPIETATNLLTWAAGYIHRNLLAGGVDDPYLRGIYRHNLISNGARMVAAIGAIRDLSSRWQITPLKSFGMTGDRYSRGLRPLADFDFYVAMDSAAAVKSRLEELGFDALMNVSEREFGSRVLRQRGSWNFMSAARVDLDLHWRLLEHLSTSLSEKLVAENSRIVDSEFGTIRRLDDELMLICIGVHYQLLGSSLMSGFFDFAHLLRHVDVGKAARLAHATGSARDIVELCDQLIEIVGTGERPELDRLRSILAASVARTPLPSARRLALPLFQKIPARYFERELLTRPIAYRVWFALGRLPVIERLLVRVGGPLSRPWRDVPAGPPSADGELGIGWHYPYPNDTHRWANSPDARIVFTGKADARRVRITLNPGEWNATPISRFRVFANGYPLGECVKPTSDFEFELPPRAVSGTIELSLRHSSYRRFSRPGIYEKWYRMMTPVTSIELLPDDAGEASAAAEV